MRKAKPQKNLSWFFWFFLCFYMVFGHLCWFMLILFVFLQLIVKTQQKNQHKPTQIFKNHVKTQKKSKKTRFIKLTRHDAHKSDKSCFFLFFLCFHMVLEHPFRFALVFFVFLQCFDKNNKYY